ncbi:MAG: FGGY family carbohydrate kinase [Kofleriaceae bacterium]
MSLWLGLDLGTQSLKAVVWRLDGEGATGEVLGAASQSYPTAYPRPGWAEQETQRWEAALAPAIGESLRRAGRSAAELRGLGVTGQLDGAIAVSVEGESLSPALIWQDRRAHAERPRLSARRLQELTGQLLDASHLAPKVRVLERQLRGAGLAPARYHQPVSFLVERLTGRAVMDPSLASTTLLLELAQRRWSAELCAAWDVDARWLPELAPAGALAGDLSARGAALTGLPRGLPVSVGTGDDFAAALGAGLTQPGRVLCSLGTAEVVGALDPRPLLDRRPDAAPIVETHAYPTGHFFLENPGWTCGAALRWLRRLLGVDSDAALDALAAEAPPGAGGVTFFPALAGAMTPAWAPDVRGALTGLSSEHDRGHLARAVLEGTAFACRDVIERLRALGVACERVVLSGGGSASELWTQLRADVTGLPHERARHADSAAIAAAMLTAVAAGATSLDELGRLAGAPRPGAEPTATHVEALEDAYQRYRSASAALLGARVGRGLDEA